MLMRGPEKLQRRRGTQDRLSIYWMKTVGQGRFGDRDAPRRYKRPTHMRIPCNPVGLAPVGIYGLYNDAAPFIATRHATSRQTPHRHRSRQWYCHGGMVCARGGDGRGNLRENREDPAPTVGIAIRIAPKGRPLPPPCACHATPHPPMSPWF